MNELTMVEQLFLAIKMDGLCPRCGRAICVEPKDIFYRLDCHGTRNGAPFKKNGGWRHRCKCGKDISITFSYEFGKVVEL